VFDKQPRPGQTRCASIGASGVISVGPRRARASAGGLGLCNENVPWWRARQEADAATKVRRSQPLGTFTRKSGRLVCRRTYLRRTAANDIVWPVLAVETPFLRSWVQCRERCATAPSLPLPLPFRTPPCWRTDHKSWAAPSRSRQSSSW
jgi:hypothetical protein